MSFAQDTFGLLKHFFFIIIFIPLYAAWNATEFAVEDLEIRISGITTQCCCC